jgi:hypothetical protein
MTKIATGLLGLILFIYACSNKNETAKTSIRFTSFEIGYTNGWTRGISFWVDSNKIFLAPQMLDTVKYGLLPDSIIQLIDTTLFKIIADTTIKSKDGGCVDCSIIGIHAVIGDDTISIHQVGNIDKVFLPLIKTLQYFLDSTNHSTIHSVLFLESQKIAFAPPLSPISTDRNFLPPKTKRGR